MDTFKRWALPALAGALLIAALLAGFLEPVAGLFRRIPFDYNEGWNAYWAQAAIQGKTLYPPLLADVTNNYPPLSFYVVGAVGWLLGDFIVAGRLIALIALCAVILQIALWLRATGSSRGMAMCGAALFTAMFVTLAPKYVGADDPQLLAHALMLAGLLVLWRCELRPGALVLAAVLMMSAGFTKHLLLPIPVASTLWILLRHRSRFVLWLCICAATAAALCVAAYLAYGPLFFENMLLGRVFSWHKAFHGALRCLRIEMPVLALAGAALGCLALVRRWGSIPARVGFALLYLFVAVAVAIAADGGAGVDTNAFFDATIALSMLAAASLEAILELDGLQAGGSFVQTALLVGVCALFGSLGLHLGRTVPTHWRALATLDARESEARQDIALIRERSEGRAACEVLSLCYWAGQPFTLDFFNYGQKVATGILPLRSCDSVLDPRNVHLVQIQPGFRPDGVSRLPSLCNEIIQQRFKVIRNSANGAILVAPARASP